MLTAKELSTLMSLAYLCRLEDSSGMSSIEGKELVARLHTDEAKTLAKYVCNDSPAPAPHKDNVQRIRTMAGVG